MTIDSVYVYVYTRFSVGVSNGMATYGPNHSLGIQLDTTKGANRGERFTALYLDEYLQPRSQRDTWCLEAGKRAGTFTDCLTGEPNKYS